MPFAKHAEHLVSQGFLPQTIHSAEALEGVFEDMVRGIGNAAERRKGGKGFEGKKTVRQTSLDQLKCTEGSKRGSLTL